MKGKTIFRLNATPFGGGVAEMIPYFAALLNSLGVRTRWLTMASPFGQKRGFFNPPADFFGFTCGIHYGLQDSQKAWSVYEQKKGKMCLRPVNKKDKTLYLRVNQDFGCLLLKAQKKLGKADVIINDDPQPAAVAGKIKKRDQLLLWRFHPFGDPQSLVWEFLNPFILEHDAAVLTLPDYLPDSIRKEVPVKQNFPFIDPYHQKLKKPSLSKIKAILREFGIDPKKPILAQVSRYDPDKGPLDVIEVFNLLKKQYSDLQLVYVGTFAYDNPTSVMVLDQMEKRIKDLGLVLGKDVFLLHTAMEHHRPVGSFYQELAALWYAPNSYLIQLSTKEGFGLVVTEAAWCGKPVVGSRVGGIVPQIKHGKTGFLAKVGNHREAADCVSRLIKSPKLNQKMGQAAHEHIRQNFLITANLLRWLKIINSLTQV